MDTEIYQTNNYSETSPNLDTPCSWKCKCLLMLYSIKKTFLSDGIFIQQLKK